MKSKFLILAISLFPCVLLESFDKEFYKSRLNPQFYYIMDSRTAGMFSVWYDVLALVFSYESSLVNGIEVSFKDSNGLYLQSNYGDNWWNYYCEPIKYGNIRNLHYVTGDPSRHPGYMIGKILRSEVKVLIDKYIHIKPFILEKVNEFQDEHFLENYIIAIHYRGTDKITSREARYVSYNEVISAIEKVIKKNTNAQYKLFIATDEQNFLDYMIQKYGDRVCFTNATRSKNDQPLHVGKSEPYKQGLEAITDMLLLSRGDYLIRTLSNLSAWSSYFNPDIPVLTIE